MNLVLTTHAGDTFDNVAKKAKEWAIEKNRLVEFDFNGIRCIVGTETDLKLLWTDYTNAHMMNWESVGHDCKPYSDVLQKDIDEKRRAREAKRQQEQDEYDRKCEEQKREAHKLTAGSVIEITEGKQSDYLKFVENNSKDGYSKAVVDYAEQWALLMQLEIAKGRPVIDCADETQKPLSYLGITGFQYGAVVHTLSTYWKHGEELRKWHNKEYGHEGDGVVNPAVLTINTKP